MNLFKIFGIKNVDEQKHEKLGTLFAVIEDMMADHSVDKIKLITGWAGLLGRVAYADMDFDEREIMKIRQILNDTHNLDEHSAGLVADLFIKKRTDLLSIEDHLYARMINDVATKNQKIELLEALYQIAAADDTIRESEDSTIRTISRDLHLSHTDFITVRRHLKNKLAVFQS